MTKPKVLWGCCRFGRSKLPFFLVYCTVRITNHPDFVLVYKIDEADIYGRKDLRPVFGPVFGEMTRSAKAYIDSGSATSGHWPPHRVPHLSAKTFGALICPDSGREPIRSKGPRDKYGRPK